MQRILGKILIGAPWHAPKPLFEMTKRKAVVVQQEHDFAMQNGYSDSMKDAISTKISSSSDKDKADACAMLSSLDPRSPSVQDAFLTKEFCCSFLYPCLDTTSVYLVMEAANTVKTWMSSACDDEDRTLLRKLYALQVMPHLLRATSSSVALLDNFVNLSDNEREAAQELFESLLACFIILAENIEVCLDQINRGDLIRLIVGVYEKKQFLSDQVVIVASECLSIVSEDNEAFYSEGPHGIRLYTLLHSLPKDWTNSKALPLSTRALYIFSSVHSGPKDNTYELCLSTLCNILTNFLASSVDYSNEVIMAAFETLATMMEDIDPQHFSTEEQQMVLQALELVCRSLTKLAHLPEKYPEMLITFDRGLGCLTNLLVLCLEFIGENILLMIWNEAIIVWLSQVHNSHDSLSSLLSVLRILQLNLSKGMAARNCTADQLQSLVSAVLPFKPLHEPAILIILSLCQRDKPYPAGLDQIVHKLSPSISRADPRFQLDLQDALDDVLGASTDPLSIRLQSILN